MTEPREPLVVQAEELDPACAAWLAERCRVEVCPVDDPRFGLLMKEAQGLVVRTYTRVDRALLDRAPRLRVAGRAGVGLDNFDLHACRERGVVVVSTPDANTRAVVELVTAFILDALRPRLFLDKPLDIKAWKSLRQELLAPRQLADLTLGILGLGRVGGGVARVGAAFNMRVLYSDLRTIPEDARHGALPVELDALLDQSDILSVHVDDRPTNRALLNRKNLRLMKPSALLINTSRGFVIDPPGLADWLRSDPAARAVLDVHDPEPFGPDYPLLGLPNAHLSPHIGAATRTAHRNMSWVVRDVWRVLSGEAPEFPAAPSR
ncbi:MAG: NAD(P)-dependent oxidoreductase [Planctomycetota bacterium]|nr:NAD(P)-dependent oxidoreductase [Planctomycetota bacterium]